MNQWMTRGNAGIAATVTLGVIVALAGTGCGGGGGFAGANSTSVALSGTWIKTALEGAGRSVSCSNSLGQEGATVAPERDVADISENGVVLESCGYDEAIEFRPSGLNSNRGTYVITIPPPRLLGLSTESGDYRIDGNTLTLTRTSTGYDTNGDDTIGTGETTVLTTVNDINNLPAQPRQRAVFRVEIENGELRLIPVAPATTASTAVVNGAVNAPFSGVTQIYARR